MENAFRRRYTYFNTSLVICFYLMIIIRCAESFENYVCEDSCDTLFIKDFEIKKNELLDENCTSLSNTSSPNPEQSDSVPLSICNRASNYTIEEFENTKEKTIFDKLFNEQKKIINELKEHIKQTKSGIDWDILDKDVKFKCLYDDFLEYFDIIRDTIIIGNRSWLLNHNTDLASTFYNIEYILYIINRLKNDYETKRLDLVQMVCLKQERQHAIKQYNKMSHLYNFHVEKRDKLVDCFNDLMKFFDMIECFIKKNSTDLNADFNVNDAELTIMEAFDMFNEKNKNSLNSLYKALKEIQETLTNDLLKTRDSIINFLAYINYDELNV